jgi:hypothetical protein
MIQEARGLVLDYADASVLDLVRTWSRRFFCQGQRHRLGVISVRTLEYLRIKPVPKPMSFTLCHSVFMRNQIIMPKIRKIRNSYALALCAALLLLTVCVSEYGIAKSYGPPNSEPYKIDLDKATTLIKPTASISDHEYQDVAKLLLNQVKKRRLVCISVSSGDNGDFYAQFTNSVDHATGRTSGETHSYDANGNLVHRSSVQFHSLRSSAPLSKDEILACLHVLNKLGTSSDISSTADRVNFTGRAKELPPGKPWTSTLLTQKVVAPNSRTPTGWSGCSVVIQYGSKGFSGAYYRFFHNQL